MNDTTLAIGFGTQELLIILLIVFVLFGARHAYKDHYHRAPLRTHVDRLE